MLIFHTTSGFKRPNMSRNTRWNCNVSLLFKNLLLKLYVVQAPLQKLGRNSLYWVLRIFHILPILLRTSQVNNVWVLKLLWPGKPALLV